MMDYAIMEGAEGDPKPEPRSFDLRPFAGITGGWGPVWFGFGSTGTYGNVPSTSIENIKDAIHGYLEVRKEMQAELEKEENITIHRGKVSIPASAVPMYA